MGQQNPIGQLRLTSSGTPPRLYLLSSILSTCTLDEATYDELFEAIGFDSQSLRQVAHSITASSCPADIKYHLLLVGLSRFTQSRYASLSAPSVCIAALADSIADVFDADATASPYASERHPMVRAMYLVKRTAYIFVERIESRLVRRAGTPYFEACVPFLLAAQETDEALGRAIRGMLTRVGANGYDLVDVDVLVSFMVDHILVPWDATGQEGGEGLSETMRDVVDVLCANDPSKETVQAVLDAIFQRLLRGEATRMALQCLSFFLDELSPALILPCAILGLELGEDPDASACFDLVMAILSSVDSKDSMDGLSLATLECVCRRGSFYCQPGSRVKGAVRACLGLCRSIMKGMISWGPPEDVFFRLELEAARAAGADADSAVDNAAVARVLAHLAHGSIAVRLEALDVIRRLVESSKAAADEIAFFALPVLLHAIRSTTTDSTGSTGTKAEAALARGVYLRELLFTLASLGAGRACVPFVARTLQSLLTDAPQELVGVAVRLFGRLFFASRKAYASLKVVLLGCDMELEADGDLTIEQSAAVQTLLDICERAPEKGKDFVHMIHACASSPHPSLAAAGIRCIRFLCAAGILDFEKAWVVVSRMYPDLPEHDELAAAWVELIGCVFMEDDLNSLDDILKDESGDQSPRAAVLTNVIELVWAAAGHASPLVRAKAYDALAFIDWDVAEAVDCLRPPVAYARLLDAETDPEALVALEAMLDAVLELEHADRRKQLLELKSQVPAPIQQSHRQRFYKLTQSIPRALLKENSLLGSGSFVALNLKTRDYAKTAKELCAPDVAAPVDLLVVPEYVPLLVDAWKNFIGRWTRVGAVGVSGKNELAHAGSVWTELGLGAYAPAQPPAPLPSPLPSPSPSPSSTRTKPPGPLPQLTNPNILAAMLACASLHPAHAKAAVATITRILDDPLQHQTIRNVCLILAAISADLAHKHISKSASDALRTTAMRAMADALDEHRLLACDILGIQASDSDLDDPRSIRATCDRLRLSALHVGENGDARIADALSELVSMSDAASTNTTNTTTATTTTYPLLAAARLLTDALSHGHAPAPITPAALTTLLMASLTSNTDPTPATRANAAHAALALDVLFQHQLKNPRNHDESVADDVAAESQLESICNLPVGDPRRMAAIPFIADMSTRATAALGDQDGASLRETSSLEQLSTSAIGHLTDALRKLDPARLSARQACTLLHVLTKTSHGRGAGGAGHGQRDWSGALRRCIKAFGNDSNDSDDRHGVQTAVVAFAAHHPLTCTA